jgi:hypothetical protein
MGGAWGRVGGPDGQHCAGGRAGFQGRARGAAPAAAPPPPRPSHARPVGAPRPARPLGPPPRRAAPAAMRRRRASLRRRPARVSTAPRPSRRDAAATAAAALARRRGGLPVSGGRANRCRRGARRGSARGLGRGEGAQPRPGRGDSGRGLVYAPLRRRSCSKGPLAAPATIGGIARSARVGARVGTSMGRAGRPPGGRARGQRVRWNCSCAHGSAGHVAVKNFPARPTLGLGGPAGFRRARGRRARGPPHAAAGRRRDATAVGRPARAAVRRGRAAMGRSSRPCTALHSSSGEKGRTIAWGRGGGAHDRAAWTRGEGTRRRGERGARAAAGPARRRRGRRLGGSRAAAGGWRARGAGRRRRAARHAFWREEKATVVQAEGPRGAAAGRAVTVSGAHGLCNGDWRAGASAGGRGPVTYRGARGARRGPRQGRGCGGRARARRLCRARVLRLWRAGGPAARPRQRPERPGAGPAAGCQRGGQRQGWGLEGGQGAEGTKRAHGAVQRGAGARRVGPPAAHTPPSARGRRRAPFAAGARRRPLPPATPAAEELHFDI